MIFELPSVASIVDDETLMVYARYSNGDYDKTSGRSVFELSEDFKKCLDRFDKLIIAELIYQNKNKKHDNR